MTRYLVTGVDGNLGSRVAKNMLKAVSGSQLVFSTPFPEKIDETKKKEWKTDGVTLIKMDYKDRAQITKSFIDNKVDRVWMVSGTYIGLPRQIQHRNVFDAAVDAHIKHLTYTSFFGANRQGYDQYVMPDHTFSEAYLKLSGLNYNIMRNNLFLENTFVSALKLAMSSDLEWVTNAGGAKANFLAKDDSARCAAALLLGKGEPNTAYDLCGKLISEKEIFELIAAYSGIPFTLKKVADEKFYDYLDARGLHRSSEVYTSGSPLMWCSNDLVSNEGSIASGMMAIESDAIKKLTGREPTDPKELLEPCSFAWRGSDADKKYNHK